MLITIPGTSKMDAREKILKIWSIKDEFGLRFVRIWKISVSEAS
jgi:hypothetical protein